MINTDSTGYSVLKYDVQGIIRRIPMERRGMSKKGYEWVLGSVMLECYEEEGNGSAQLGLITWDNEMIERINRLGVGKKVIVTFHIESKEKYERIETQVILDDIKGIDDGDNFVYKL